MKKNNSKRKIFEGIKNTSIELIQEGINDGEDVNSLKGQPLINAFNIHNFEIVDFLIKNGAILHTRILNTLIQHSDKKSIDYIINNLNIDISIFILYFIKNDDIDSLIKYYYNINNIHLNDDIYMKTAIKYNSFKILKYFFNVINDFKNDNYNLYLLQYAIKINNIELVKKIVDLKIDLNEFSDKIDFSDNILLIAIKNKNINIIKYLIDNGADPSLCPNKEENLFLYETYEIGDLEIFKLIYDNCSTPYVEGVTAIEYFCGFSTIDMFDYIISKGININSNEYNLVSNLLYNSDTKTFEHLIKLGYNKNIEKLFLYTLNNDNIEISKIIIKNFTKKLINENSLNILLKNFYLDEFPIYSSPYKKHNYEKPNYDIIDMYLLLIKNGADINYNGYDFLDKLIYNEEFEYIKTFLDLGFRITDQKSDNKEIQVLLNLYNRKQKINKIIK